MSKQLKTTLTWVTTILGLAGLISIGVWVGSIQTNISQMRDDIEDNENLSKANKAYFVKIDEQERGRLNRLSDSVRIELELDKDEKWRVKNAISGIWREIRYRHGQRAEDLAFGGSSPTILKGEIVEDKVGAVRRPTEEEISKIASQADEAIEEVIEPNPEVTELQKLMF